MVFERNYLDCYARFDGKTLVVGNQYFERSWVFTQDAPFSKSLVNKLIDKKYDIEAPFSDWQLPDGSEPENGHLTGVASETVEADGFTSQCLRVGARWAYKEKHLSIRWDIKLYPDAPGLWTRLYALGNPDMSFTAPNGARAGFMPMVGRKLTGFGYYNDTQNRNKDETEILREEPVLPGETADWANALLHYVDAGGWMTVKESHKCPNQMGYDTGAFVQVENGAAVTGWGLKPEDIKEWKLRGGWASWFVVWGGALSPNDALKAFDRVRYPFDNSRDTYIMANTWGSNRARDAARQESIIKEIDIAKEMGIDVVQIDDGWQTGKKENTWIGPVRWQPDQEERFPEGWRPIREYAAAKGVTMGLWSAWTIPDEELIENMKQGDFRLFKIDFAVLDSYEKIEGLMEKASHLTDASGGRIRINWDVTENPPRVGYYFGREFGNIYLANRKTDFPQRVVYTPRLVLRDAWQLSRWLPLNKFQITYQNIDRVDSSFSNAREYTHDYCVAITLMASPIFFQELKFLSEEAKKTIKPLINAYKSVREEILTGRVSPIGDKPCDKSITGFRCEATKDHGYITLFRELYNTTEHAAIALKSLKNRNISFTNLLTKDTWTCKADEKGNVTFSIPNAPGFLFLKYSISE
ncbi:MAG: alpha-galactosidase [Firmicutes bacterium]|nr:alpha-galactosidase [Bacillota bacterium]